MSHEGVGLDPELQELARKGLRQPMGPPLGLGDVPLEAVMLRLGRREGREVVPADHLRRATCPMPSGRARAATRTLWRSRAGVAPATRAPGSSRFGPGRLGGRRNRRGRPRPRSPRSPTARSRSGAGRARRAARHRARSSPPDPRRGRPASVRPATVSETRSPQDPLQRRLQLALHGAQPRLRRPAGERRPVVGDREADDCHALGRRRGARPARGRPSRWSPSGAGQA